MPPFITALLGSGLRLVANAALVKGKQHRRNLESLIPPGGIAGGVHARGVR